MFFHFVFMQTSTSILVIYYYYLFIFNEISIPSMHLHPLIRCGVAGAAVSTTVTQITMHRTSPLSTFLRVVSPLEGVNRPNQDLILPRW